MLPFFPLLLLTSSVAAAIASTGTNTTGRRSLYVITASPDFNSIELPLEHIGQRALMDVTDALPVSLEQPTIPELDLTFCCLFFLILSDSSFNSVAIELRYPSTHGKQNL